MKSILKIFLILGSLLTGILGTDNGYTDAVTWDRYSLLINGERLIIFSGEFHYNRLPVPALWTDVLQKYKANGLNAISIYVFWNFHSPRQGVYDFESPSKDLQVLFDAAKEVGLYVVVRPGPYVNAEYNAGGIALWATDGSGGKLRTSDEKFHQAWLPYFEALGPLILHNQITEGGPIIALELENELQETRYSPTDTLVLYMEQLKKAWRDIGIVVPFTHNEKGMRAVSWSSDYNNVGGAVDIYGLDSYPGGLSCTNQNSGFNVVRTYYQWFQNYSYTQPEYLPEFEGGWFQPWGGFFYDQCLAEHSPEFADVYYKNNIAQRVTLFNIYMAFGGTNWGHSAAPVVYTSYDYAAPLRETREVLDKFKQTKLLALFTRVSSALWKTNMETNGTAVATKDPSLFTWVLRNPDAFTGFYFVGHTTSSSRANTAFSLEVTASDGNHTITSLDLQGRQMRIIVTDYTFGDYTLLYSSAQVLTYALLDRAVLVFYLNNGQKGSFAFKSGLKSTLFTTYPENTDFATAESGNDETHAFEYTQSQESVVVDFEDGPLLYLLETTTAWNFFAPATTQNPALSPSQQILVLGPYLVREAYTSGTVVHVVGDNVNTTTIEVYVGKSSIKKITWNGVSLPTTKTAYGSLTATISGTADRVVRLPELNEWKVKDSLPEASSDYDDSRWTIANKSTTLNPVAPLSLPVLFASDYKYYVGNLIYRGYFGAPSAAFANITVQGGISAGWSAWLNGKFIGGFNGNSTVITSTVHLDFSSAKLNTGKPNVLTIVTDYVGNDQTSQGPQGPHNPRGILGAILLDSSNTVLNFSQWKIQGNAGADQYIDPVRGPLNEGGLYGERLGWHLPNFDYEGWETGSPLEGFTGAGIKWYNTEFDLNIDEDLDAPVGLELGAPAGTIARVMLFVNGYQYGKYVPHIGPQTRFPIPPGILNNRGKNHLSISVWAQTEAGASLNVLKLFTYAVYQTGFDFSKDWHSLKPGWKRERLQFA
ncbi:Beta-galactosidase [Dactylellina cionopaga]|nr:Beta-galactosidase [Dactylellina cionopaga]